MKLGLAVCYIKKVCHVPKSRDLGSKVKVISIQVFFNLGFCRDDGREWSQLEIKAYNHMSSIETQNQL